ncbi:DUF1109 domain-containing protein [Allopontixanthobacter sp.]|uniref:DUF1109 domain-containing protein n=1 Tax=Allopontixanthobacter sp. TaxID=2906452 RepID=UPI002ABCAC73|nr:DUF1109 domain-containing protein [Allopontixanthobacter sp.]MDZ4307018.1 DUF1109 domain-containing protein [Allopontixanthobacter sp.]
MRTNNHDLIGELVDDLQPHRPLTLRRGLATASGSTVLTIGVMALLAGVRPDVAAGHFNPVFLLATGLFLMLGVAATFAVISMSRPQVGNTHGGWIWAAAMAALLPASAAVLGFADRGNAFFQSQPAQGISCLVNGSLLGLIVGGALTVWLRRGAPTSPEQAGLLTGLAAGSIGIFAYSLHCPYDDLYHIGLWHSLAVVASAVAGRIFVPKLIQW